ncbi:MAG: cation diffusion facilitator family transporter [Chromatiales bacterium]|nr:cation diffusion facilitator family transporter [Chromatiales bacterium]
MSEVVEDRAQVRLQVTQRVTLVGAIVNIILALSKTIFGFIAQSQSLIADGIHSFSDLFSDALVLIAARHSHRGPDEAHPYGHGRFETAATMGLGVLLGLVAVGICWDAVERLFSPEELLQPTTLAVYVALFSVLANEGLYHYTNRAARQIKSDMLKANAWHHRSDAVSSIVVLIGVVGTLAGLPYLDAIAAIAVALMIGHIGWEVGWPAFQELVDAGLDEDQVAKITKTILSIGGVEAVHMLRTRKLGGEASVDVHVLLSQPWLSVSEGHLIGQTVIDRLREDFDEITDVTVHIDPEDDEISPPSKGLPLRADAESILTEAWQGVPVAAERNRLLFHYLDGQVDVDVYFPLATFTDMEQTAVLTGTLQEALEPYSEFGEVRVYFG